MKMYGICWIPINCKSWSFGLILMPLILSLDQSDAFYQASCSDSPCVNGGTCGPPIHDSYLNFYCKCSYGYYGVHCEKKSNNCRNNPCKNGFACKDLEHGKYECNCKGTEYIGMNCEFKDKCLEMAKLNQNPCGIGKCIPDGNTFNCSCHRGHSYLGDDKKSCITFDHCIGPPCHNGGTCQNITKDPYYQCHCRPGYIGLRCETDFDECSSNPCQNGATCQDLNNNYRCNCPPKYTGDQCEIKKVIETELQSKCARESCSSLNNNGQCDPECDLKECRRDGGDCHPWAKCDAFLTSILYNKSCSSVFGDGQCDRECNSKECMFDGFDCHPPKSQCDDPIYCNDVFANGKCETSCNSSACGFDGGDCHQNKQNLISDRLLLVIKPNRSIKSIRNVMDLKDMTRQLSIVLKLIVKSNFEPSLKNENDMMKDNNISLQFDSSACLQTGSTCLQNIVDVANFLEAALISQSNLGELRKYLTIDTVTIFILDTPESPINPSKTTQSVELSIIVPILGIIMIALIVMAVILLKRKQKDHLKFKHNKTWYPPIGVQMDVDNSLSSEECKYDYPINGHVYQHGILKSDYHGNSSINGRSDSSEISCVSTYLPSQEHQRRGEAMDVEMGHVKPKINPMKREHEVEYEAQTVLLPKDEEYSSSHSSADIVQSLAQTLQNSDGLHPTQATRVKLFDTLLKQLTSTKIASTPQSQNKCAHQTAAINKPINLQGESILQLAARLNAGPDILGALIEAGADMHHRDIQGNIPITTAASADAVESVEELLRREREFQNSQRGTGGSRTNRSSQQIKTNPEMGCEITINKRNRSKGGSLWSPDKRETTPLIAAVKAGCESVSLHLLNDGGPNVGGMPLNSVDDQGRNVLHWAAATNAIKVMQKLFAVKGISKLVDSRDDLERTPLFLAAREGGLESCQLLLEHNANINLTDHADRTPIQEAFERGHHSVYELLLHRSRLQSHRNTKASKAVDRTNTPTGSSSPDESTMQRMTAEYNQLLNIPSLTAAPPSSFGDSSSSPEMKVETPTMLSSGNCLTKLPPIAYVHSDNFGGSSGYGGSEDLLQEVLNDYSGLYKDDHLRKETLSLSDLEEIYA